MKAIATAVHGDMLATVIIEGEQRPGREALEIYAETSARVAFLTTWQREPADVTSYVEKPCLSYLMHGPGHQSKTRCEVLKPHDTHYAIVMGEEATWTGDEAVSGYFNEMPRADH